MIRKFGWKVAWSSNIPKLNPYPLRRAPKWALSEIRKKCENPLEKSLWKILWKNPFKSFINIRSPYDQEKLLNFSRKKAVDMQAQVLERYLEKNLKIGRIRESLFTFWLSPFNLTNFNLNFNFALIWYFLPKCFHSKLVGTSSIVILAQFQRWMRRSGGWLWMK